MTTTSLGQRIDKRIIKKADHDGWLYLALRLVEARRILSAPVSYFNNRRKARSIVDASRWSDFIPKEDGFRPFLIDTFAELPDVISACEDIYAQYEADLNSGKKYNKPFFYNIMDEESLKSHPILLDFALSEAITEAATGYLGHIPRLNSIGVFLSPVNDTISGSQKFHSDGDCLKQVKLFVNIWEVAPGGGGFTFIPKSKTNEFLRKSGLNYNLSDEDVAKFIPDSEQIVANGPPGSGLLCDTSGCLHMGSRARKMPRLILKIQFVSRPDALLPRPIGRTAHGGHVMVTKKLLENFDIKNPNAGLYVD
ncbi:hypothetical protein [Magnetovibrio blakemorei]|uniref:Phytanoyl-CoA dioxygenase n=1 Tax=Magnetovibrio blakemorei TaxID=28181 RepID=A0A1E5Q3V0_9PROT|nr:hypothetical protein [Magnetovibrio blakemorei]OEJ63842.1 hypothetical protein BEN30_17220 [Magnetovibrio blakemorei]